METDSTISDQHRDRRTSPRQASDGRCDEVEKLEELRELYRLSVPKIIDYHWKYDRKLATLRDIEEIVPELERSATKEARYHRIWKVIRIASIALREWMEGHASWQNAIEAAGKKSMPRIPRSARMRATMYLIPDEKGIPKQVRDNLARVELEWLINDNSPTAFWKGALLDDFNWRHKYMEGYEPLDKPWIRREEIATIPALLSAVFSVREQRSMAQHAASGRQSAMRHRRRREIIELSDDDDETNGQQHIALPAGLLSPEKQQKLDCYRSRMPADWANIPADQRGQQNLEYKALLKAEDLARSAQAETRLEQLQTANDQTNNLQTTTGGREETSTLPHNEVQELREDVGGACVRIELKCRVVGVDNMGSQATAGTSTPNNSRAAISTLQAEIQRFREQNAKLETRVAQ
jgi:hypothetical protein